MNPGGYLWWYLDALSDDEQHGITLIAFVGSVFSPYYAWTRRRGNPDPQHHCAINVALYGKGGKRWAMTERGRGDLDRDSRQLRVGPSQITWDGETLVVHVDEITSPIPSRIRGTVRLRPHYVTNQSHVLDAHQRHHWRPIAPAADVEVDLAQPALRWRGRGYFDSNIGTEPLEAGFRYWDWSRAVMSNGDTVVFYESEHRCGSHGLLALRFDGQGNQREISVPPRHHLPTARTWRAPRSTRADSGSARILQTFEDTPFYARSLVQAHIHGEPALAFHESLSMDRFTKPVVQLMLPFRMPRRARG